MIVASLFLLTVTSANAENKQSRSDRDYGGSRYKLESDYPSPERRYSRKELDQARRRAGSSIWMKEYGRKDPIYQSDQYRGSRYKLESDYPSPERRYSRKELDQARRRAGNSLWMKQYGRKDPIYRSDQYRGRSSGDYRQPHRRNRYDRRW